MATRRLCGFALSLILVGSVVTTGRPGAAAAQEVPEEVQIRDPRGDAHRGLIASPATYMPEADILEVWFNNDRNKVEAHMHLAAPPGASKVTYVVKAEPPQRYLRTSPTSCFAFTATFERSQDDAARAAAASFRDNCGSIGRHAARVSVTSLPDDSAILSWSVSRAFTVTFSDCSYLLNPSAKTVQVSALFNDTVDETPRGSTYRMRRFVDAPLPDLANETGSLSRINVSPTRQQANGDGFTLSVSRSGRFVAFDSSASNLTKRCSFHDYTIFAKDRRTGQVDRVDLGGETAYRHDIFDPQISSDGSRIVYAEGDFYDGEDSYWLYDRIRQRSQRITAPGSRYAGSPFPVGRGRFIGFTGRSNRGPSRAMLWDTAQNRYIDLHQFLPLDDRRSSALLDASHDGSTFLIRSLVRKRNDDLDTRIFVLTRPSGDVRVVGKEVSEYGPTQMHLSGDGRFIVFNSKSRTWSDSDRDEEWDIFLHSIRSDRTRLLSVTPGGKQIREYVAMESAGISHNGGFIAFAAGSDKLARTAKGSPESVYVYDRRSRRITVANTRFDGTVTKGYVWDVDIAANRVFFVSSDLDLVRDDTNRQTDVFTYVAHD